MAFALIALFLIALVWAIFGQIDIVAVAPGRIVVSERTKLIQPLERSVVKRVLVKDGDHVQAGQPLVELDPTSANADKTSVDEQLKAAQSEVLRTRVLLRALDAPAAAGARKPVPVLDTGGLVEWHRRRHTCRPIATLGRVERHPRRGWPRHSRRDRSPRTTDKFSLNNWYLGSQYHVEQFKTSDGKTLLDSRCRTCAGDGGLLAACGGADDAATRLPEQLEYGDCSELALSSWASSTTDLINSDEARLATRSWAKLRRPRPET